MHVPLSYKMDSEGFTIIQYDLVCIKFIHLYNVYTGFMYPEAKITSKYNCFEVLQPSILSILKSTSK